MALEHRGIAITMNERTGAFSAKINGENESRTSLAALKKAIDKSLATDFVPFSAYRDRSYEERKLPEGDVPGMIKIKVVNATENKRASYWEKHKFVTEDGRTLTNAVLADNPKNIAAYLALHTFDAETQRIDKERKEKSNQLRAKIEYVVAATFFKTPA